LDITPKFAFYSLMQRETYSVVAAMEDVLKLLNGNAKKKREASR
jgi:hypothetical protein